MNGQEGGNRISRFHNPVSFVVLSSSVRRSPQIATQPQEIRRLNCVNKEKAD